MWESNLEYRPLRQAILGCEDEDLMKHLQQYENLLRAKGETIIYHCKKEQQRNIDLYLKLKAKQETTLGTLVRMQEFLVKDVGLDDAIFIGFCEGCIELYCRQSPETASIAMVRLHSDMSRLILLRLGVSMVELSGHWAIDTARGRVTYLKVSLGLMNQCSHCCFYPCLIIHSSVHFPQQLIIIIIITRTQSPKHMGVIHTSEN